MSTQSTHGLDGLFYMGSPFSPAAVYVQERDPIVTDQGGIPIGTIWINSVNKNVFLLVAKLYNPITKKMNGTWEEFIGDTGTVTEIDTDAGNAFPAAGVINILGGLNINSAGAGNTVTINLDDTVHVTGELIADGNLVTTAGNINLPNTNTTGTAGIIQFDVNRFISNYGVGNTFVGQASGNTTLTGSQNSGYGTFSSTALTSGSQNCFYGVLSGQLTTTGSSNVGLGWTALRATTSANNNTAVGWGSMGLLTSGTDNIALGYASGGLYTTESSNICIGNPGVVADANVIRLGLDGNAAGEQNNCYIAGTTHITRNLSLKYSDGAGNVGYIYTGDGTTPGRFISNPGTFNTFIGEDSGSFTITTAQENVGCGAESLQSLIGGSGNTAVGFSAGTSIVNNIDNVCIGHNAGNLLASGNLNVFVGAFAGAVLTGNAGAIGNTALGYAALNSCTGGSANLCLGGLSGQNLTTNESHNLLIYNSGVTGRSHEIRIGSTGGGDGEQNKCWIAAIRGVTTDVADAIPVLIDSTGQLGTVSSSERYKENIEDMGPESDMIYALRPVTFSYKSNSSHTKQYGLIAEEVNEVFPGLVIYDKEGLPDTVKYHDLPVLLLNELQKCVATISNLQERIVILEKSLRGKKAR